MLLIILGVTGIIGIDPQSVAIAAVMGECAGGTISPAVFNKVKIPKGYQPVYLSWIDTEGSHDIREISGKLSDMLEQCWLKKQFWRDT